MDNLFQSSSIDLGAPINVEQLQLWTVTGYDLHCRVVDVLHARHVDVKQLGVPEKEEVYARPLNLATFNTEILEVPTFLVGHPCSQTEPLVSQLYAASKIEVLDKCTGFEHNLDQGLGGDLLVVCLAIEARP